MLSTIQIGWVLVLIALTAIIVLIVNKLGFQSYSKLCVYFFIFGFFLYSGVGICVENISKLYLIQYFLFSLFFCLAFKLSNRILVIQKIKERKQVFQPEFYSFCAFVFWAIMLIRVVYPVNRLPYLLNPTISLIGVFNRTTESAVLSLLNMLLILLRPVYYIYLYKRASMTKTIVLLSLETYLNTVIGGYIARSGLIAQILFVILSAMSKRAKENNFINDENRKFFGKVKRVLIALFVVFLLTMPILYEFQFSRLGVSSSSSLSAYDKIDGLLKTEFSFPKMYPFCSDFHNCLFFPRFLVYVLTLPIPSVLFNVPNRLLLNQEYSIALTGIAYGEGGFSILLPGLLGEGIIFFGDSFAFIFGGVLGLLLGLIFTYFEKYKEFRIWSIYLCIQVLLMCRGGSQSAIAIFINGSVIVFLTSFIDNYKIKLRR